MEITGKKFMVNFEMAKAVLLFRSKTEMEFNIIEIDGEITDYTELVKIQNIELRPGLFLATWRERNGNSVVQVQDFERETIYSNWARPDGSFLNAIGTLKPIEISEL